MLALRVQILLNELDIIKGKLVFSFLLNEFNVSKHPSLNCVERLKDKIWDCC